MNIPTLTPIVKDMMSKYNLTKKDLVSFCICAVNFLEYYNEESMYDMMSNCPKKYINADSDNVRAVAGALAGERKTEEWEEEDQFAYYMCSIQGILFMGVKDGDDFEHFLSEYRRFERVYKRDIMIPVMLGCSVDDYDDGNFGDEQYIVSLINPDGMEIYKADEAETQKSIQAFKEREKAETEKKIAEMSDDKDFCILLASSTSIIDTADKYEEYNKTYYPDRDYKVMKLTNPGLLIIQTGGKDIEDVKEKVLKLVKSRIMIIGHELQEEVQPVEKVFNVVPKVLMDYNVTHVVTYF